MTTNITIFQPKNTDPYTQFRVCVVHFHQEVALSFCLEAPSRLSPPIPISQLKMQQGSGGGGEGEGGRGEGRGSGGGGVGEGRGEVAHIPASVCTLVPTAS